MKTGDSDPKPLLLRGVLLVCWLLAGAWLALSAVEHYARTPAVSLHGFTARDNQGCVFEATGVFDGGVVGFVFLRERSAATCHYRGN